MLEIEHNRNKNLETCLNYPVSIVFFFSKRQFFNNYFNKNLNNIKKSWDGIRILTGKGKKSTDIKSIFYENSTITDAKKIAESFNKYFSTIANDLDAIIPSNANNSSFNIPNVFNSFFLRPTSPHEISNIISSLNNNNYGINNMPTKLCKEINEFICEPPSKIINQSFT